MVTVAEVEHDESVVVAVPRVDHGEEKVAAVAGVANSGGQRSQGSLRSR